MAGYLHDDKGNGSSKRLIAIYFALLIGAIIFLKWIPPMRLPLLVY